MSGGGDDDTSVMSGRHGTANERRGDETWWLCIVRSFSLTALDQAGLLLDRDLGCFPAGVEQFYLSSITGLFRCKWCLLIPLYFMKS
jgi:hypothetical protein